MKNPVFDKDLTTLFKNCENVDLAPIVETILSLPSQTLTLQPAYKLHAGDHRAYVDELVYEVTSLGGHTLANLARGHGVAYADMVHDVADKLDVRSGEDDAVATLEEKIILRVLRLSAEHMTEDDRIALADLLSLEEEIRSATESDEFDDADDDLEQDETDLFETPGGRDDNVDVADVVLIERDAFPGDEVGRRLADSATALVGDRIFSAVDHVARTTRIKRAMIAASKVLIVKAVTSRLGGPLSWFAAIGRGLHDLMGPNYAASLSLIAHVGLIRQKYEQLERDVSAETAMATEIQRASAKAGS